MDNLLFAALLLRQLGETAALMSRVLVPAEQLDAAIEKAMTEGGVVNEQWAERLKGLKPVPAKGP